MKLYIEEYNGQPCCEYTLVGGDFLTGDRRKRRLGKEQKGHMSGEASATPGSLGLIWSLYIRPVLFDVSKCMRGSDREE